MPRVPRPPELVRLGPAAARRRLARAAECQGALAELRTAYAELERQHVWYRHLFEVAVEGVYHCSVDGAPTVVNLSMARMLGFDTAEALLREVPQLRQIFADPADYDGLTSQVQASGAVTEFEAQLRRRDGSTVWVCLAEQIIEDAAGRRGYLGMVTDITGRKAAEAALRYVDSHYRTPLEQIPTVILVSGVDGSTVYISPQVEAVLGYSPEEWLADPDIWADRLHPDDREKMLAVKAHSAATGEPLSADYRILARDGRVAWIREASVLVREDMDGPTLLQGIMLDITELKLARHQLEVSFEHLRQIDDDRQRLMDHLMFAQEEERRRVAAEMHDGVGQLLVSASFWIQACEESLANDGQLAADELASARSLVMEALLEVRRAISNLRPPVLDDLGLGPSLRNLATRQVESGVDLELSVEDVALSATQEMALYRIAQEALTNIHRHADAHKVKLTLTGQGDEVLLSVEDDGRGFELSAGSASKRLSFGLDVMSERAALVGGELHVTSEPGRGTVVRASLPVAPLESP